MKVFKKPIPLWFTIVMALVVWRVVLTGIAVLAEQLPYRPSFAFANTELARSGPRYMTTWGQFDGVHYLRIIREGYKGTHLIQAFFPFYPQVVKYLSVGGINPLWVGVFLSTVCFGIGLWVLYRLVKLDEPERIAKRVLWLMLLAPTAFFYTSFYTEGLFFLLLVSCFYLARTGKWWWAGIVGIMLSATRIVGVFIVPALLYEYFVLQRKKNVAESVSTILPLLGIGSYMYYLQRVFQDPLLFYHVQSQFGSGRETTRIILLFQVFYRYIKMFLTVSIRDRLFYVVSLEFMSALVGFVGLIAGWFLTRPSYIIFCALAYLAPTLTGSFSSMPRYLLPMFPIYIVVAKVFPRWAYVLTLVATTILLIINLIYFTQGLWVA